jgi:hypothetical protein
VHRARPPSIAPLCLHAMFTLAFVFTNTRRDPRYLKIDRGQFSTMASMGSIQAIVAFVLVDS